jgi:indole-3-glycerol phosphate synthase/phosphoribosylanthranilate isomerase
MNILEKIFSERKKYFAQEQELSERSLPAQREVPLVPFFTDKPALICEFKKASPSKGDFGLTENYPTILKGYQKAGVKNFSVLTEQKHFKGNLLDLYGLKKLAPHQAFLRKDFLYSVEDIEISYRAGADAILLIADYLSSAVLEKLLATAQRYKLQTLCEVHDKQVLAKVLKLRHRPTAIGINARDLKTFRVNTTLPLKLKPYIPKGLKTVFESGVSEPYLARLIGNSRFNAILIGEAVVRANNRTKLISDIFHQFKLGTKEKPNFFTKLYNFKKDIFIKVCGITNKTDALLAKRAGADIIGVILAKSPRKTNLKFIKSLKNLDILKVAVVKDQPVKELKQLLQNNFIDGIQFHGQEPKELIYSYKGNAYKVRTAFSENFHPLVRPRRTPPLNKGEKESIVQPVELIDSEKEILKQPENSWIAGKLTPQNIRKIIRKVKPELVDVCSGVEARPGKKDPAKLKKFISEVRNV